MDQETLLTFQGYAKFFLLFAVFIIFYSYAWSIYKRQKSGERDFEKYSDLVLDDNVEADPLENRKEEKEKKEKEN